MDMHSPSPANAGNGCRIAAARALEEDNSELIKQAIVSSTASTTPSGYSATRRQGSPAALNPRPTAPCASDQLPDFGALVNVKAAEILDLGAQ